MPTETPKPTEIFHLTVEDEGLGQFRVYAEAEKTEAVPVPFQLDESLGELIAALQGRSPLAYTTYEEQEADTTIIGERLFEKFFVAPALKRYREYRKRIGGADPRIALNIPRSLYYLPWEVLRDPSDVKGQFISMQGSLIRYDVQTTDPGDTIYGDPPSSTFMFLLASTDQDPLGPFDLDDSESPLKFSRIHPASYLTFGTEVKKTQPLGLVFFGHGIIKENTGCLIFADEVRRFGIRKYTIPDPKPAHAIGTQLGTLKTTRVAYLLACESSWIGEGLAFDRTITGAILLRTRLAFVVGAQTKVNYFAARTFFFRTIEALIAGQPLDLAITEGRKDILSLDPTEETQRFSWKDWWVPVIYARTTDFDILQRPQALQLPEQAPLRESPLAAIQSKPDSTVERAQYFGAVGRSLGRLFSSDNEVSRRLL